MITFSSVKQIKDYLKDSDAMLLGNYDDCLVGVVEGFSGLVAVYDQDMILQKLMDGDGMDAEGAQEFFDFNIIGSYVGKQTPVFICGMKA